MLSSSACGGADYRCDLAISAVAEQSDESAGTAVDSGGQHGGCFCVLVVDCKCFAKGV